jgi:hypothetical protein
VRQQKAHLHTLKAHALLLTSRNQVQPTCSLSNTCILNFLQISLKPCKQRVCTEFQVGLRVNDPYAEGLALSGKGSSL